MGGCVRSGAVATMRAMAVRTVTAHASVARRRSAPDRRALVITATLGLAIAGCGSAPSPSPSPSPSASSAALSAAGPSTSPSPSPSPSPTEAAVYEHLSGVPTTADLAGRYPIAVMIDDSPAARPQAGLSAASVVWQAPAEGGIPRYMAVYQAGTPPSIGPVRSARLYFAEWAAEWRAVYLHAGGPPPLKAYLASKKSPVIDVNGRATGRVPWRRAPHNLYTTGERLRTFAERKLKATADRLAYDPVASGTLQPFRDAAPESLRGGDGGTIRVTYTSERVDYSYDPATNTWSRTVDGRAQHDALDRENGGYGATASGPAIAPTTVVVMIVPIKRSDSIDAALGRLEAASIGTGEAWVFVDGRVVAGSWSKKTVAERTRFLDAAGAEIPFPRGQIFVQVVPARASFSYQVEAAP